MRVLFAALLALPLTAFAQEDAEGAKDHPAVPRFPGFYLSETTVNDFNAAELCTGEGVTTKKEGRYWYLPYALKDGARQPSAVEILRNYTNAFKKNGGKLVWSDIEQGGACGTLMMPLGKSERWLQIELANSNTVLTLTIVELAAMTSKVELRASEMLEALNRDGFVALHGILFDTGKDSLKPESASQLDEIVTLLKENGSLKLSVEGHTDNVGNAKSNQSLSDNRALSVKKYLTGKGIEAGRLDARGWGDTKPVGDNRTEEGRRQNRRVELVKKG